MIFLLCMLPVAKNSFHKNIGLLTCLRLCVLLAHLVIPRFCESVGTLNLICLSVCPSVHLSVTKTLTLPITFALLQVELVCSFMTRPFQWCHVVTLTVTFDLLQGQVCWGTTILWICLFILVLIDLRCRGSRYHGGERRTRVGSRYRVVLGSRGTVLTSSVYHCTFRFEMSKEPISWRGAENTVRKQISCGAGEQGHCSYFISVSLSF